MRGVLRYRAKRLAGFFKAEALREMAVPDACRFLPEKALLVRDSKDISSIVPKCFRFDNFGRISFVCPHLHASFGFVQFSQ
jgi:hypothetical protein